MLHYREYWLRLGDLKLNHGSRYFLTPFLLMMIWATSGPYAFADDRLDFNQQIRPILSDHCFHCHGADEANRKAGLRLDLREAAVRTSKSGGQPLVSGDPDASEVIQRIFAEEPDLIMPPEKGGKPLSDDQKQLLRRWVTEGAEYQSHWAFQPPMRPNLPEVKEKGWPKTPIDFFVLSKLEKGGLHPSAPAKKETLIRRVSLYLTGLPPKPEEVEAFISDPSPLAYEKVVDRLLASDRYGEQMAATWLDYARYGDSHGYDADGGRQMTAWRDWVIDAFNRNEPFDQFTIEQLSGDLLPSPTQDQVIATGFNRNHRINFECGLIPEEVHVEMVIDRVETTGQTWLGLTVGCARCHDHKYDPISQKEFYQLFAFFNNVPEGEIRTKSGFTKNLDPTLLLINELQSSELSRLESLTKIAATQYKAREKELDRLMTTWEPGFRECFEPGISPWTRVEPTSATSDGGSKLYRLDDGSWLASGPNPAHDTYTVVAPISAGTLSGIRLEVFADSSLPNQSLGRNRDGNFVLSGVEAEITAPGFEAPRRAIFETAEADDSREEYEAKLLVDDDPKNGWTISADGSSELHKHQLILVTEKTLEVPKGATLTIKIKHEAREYHNIGRFRISVNSRPREVLKLESTMNATGVLPIVRLAADQRTPAEREALLNFFLKEVESPAREAYKAYTAAQDAELTYRESLPSTMVMRELPEPRDTFTLIRGQYDQPGEKVQAALPAAFAASKTGQAMNRLDLARWIVDPSNPLTARVWVNRAWEKFFGVGLSKSTENLGIQADFPSHPELLDWLATEFVRLGWNMKALQKEIVMSATYQQVSQVTPELRDKDPENRLLARGPRFRLSGEMVRDQALAVSGLLVDKLGGLPARPYMPEGVWDETSIHGDLLHYQADKGDGLYRRTLYTIWKRTAAPPSLLIFNAPSREVCTIKRSRTNTPLQALALLNEVTFVEAARKLAERMLVEGGATPEARIDFGFSLVTSRPILPRERQVLLNSLSIGLERFGRDSLAAQNLMTNGHSKANPSLPVADLAAYSLVANILLNLDEVINCE